MGRHRVCRGRQEESSMQRFARLLEQPSVRSLLCGLTQPELVLSFWPPYASLRLGHAHQLASTNLASEPPSACRNERNCDHKNQQH
ncbi:hypothetical protein D3C80_712090 [compost metagenome]